MELKDIKLFRLAKIYIAKKDSETRAKKRQEKINGIVKSLILDKSPSESIRMLREITETFNDRMDSKLKESLEATEAIMNYKKSKRK